MLATAMEFDPELRVLILAQSYDKTCYLEAMQSGALDYLEGHLSAAYVVALLETFIPRPTPARAALRGLAKDTRSSKKGPGKTQSNSVRLNMGTGYVGGM